VKKIPGKWVLAGVAFGLAICGGILVFGLHPSEASAGPFDLQAVGGVILAAAVALLAAIMIAVGVDASRSEGADAPGSASAGSGFRLDHESLRAITGLVAVVSAILAVGALTVVAINLLGSDGEESTVAITTSAFGIVSAVVSAYLGIKATVNASDKANQALATALNNQDGNGCAKPEETKKPDPAQGGRQ
jgi:hypothetical protein